jgi:hypothetical protein
MPHFTIISEKVYMIVLLHIVIRMDVGTVLTGPLTSI